MRYYQVVIEGRKFKVRASNVGVAVNRAFKLLVKSEPKAKKWSSVNIIVRVVK